MGTLNNSPHTPSGSLDQFFDKDYQMQSFKEYLAEAKKPSGAEFENIICVSYNMKSLNQDKNKAIASAETSWKPLYDNWMGVGDKIVKNSFPRPTGTMKHFGSSSAQLTPKWESYFIKTTGKKAAAATKTPKTDMYLGKQHISLKKYGGSQLMSGGKAETLATLAAAYESLPSSVKSQALDESWNALSETIEKDFTTFKLPPGGRINNFKAAIKSGVDDELTNWVKDRLQKQTEMTQTLQELLSTPEINAAVCREAMTGQQKFKDPLAVATHIMKFDERGKSDYVKIDDSYVNHVASQTSFNISFKTSGTGGNAWTATKGIFKEEIEYTNLVKEAWDHASNECLKEGLFDKVVDKVKSGVNFLKKMLKKMLNFIWNKVKSLLVSSIDKVQDILGVKLDVSNGDPRVKF